MISGKESIPRLDFDLFDKDKTSLAKDTINAFHDYGFCVFFNHTIDKDLIANCLDIYQEFFNFHKLCCVYYEREQMLYILKEFLIYLPPHMYTQILFHLIYL